MTSSPPTCSIISTEQWIAEPLLRLPFVGVVSVEDLHILASKIGFILLLAAAGTLLVHPGDLVPRLNDLQVYQVLITGCLLLALPSVVSQLSPSALRANAITCLVVLLVVAAAASHLARGSLYDARMAAAVVTKVSLLYLLVIGLLNSPDRLRITLAMIVLFVFVMTVIAILQYHQVVHLPGLAYVERHSVDAVTNQATAQVRLCGIGLFNDPNDFSLVLVTSIIVSGYFLTESRTQFGARYLLLGPLAVFVYALYLTHSRGGIVSAVAGLFVFLCARIGIRNALAVACLLLPLLLVAPWGRETNIDLENPEDTFQTRLDLWSESFDALRSAPLFGIGQGRVIDEIGQVTHNSYLQAYAEMGLLGGTAFIGAFYLVLRGLWRTAPEDRELARMRPYMLALIAAYAAGLLSLSRCYHAPTQLMIAIATAYVVLSARSGPLTIPPMNGSTLRRITGVGMLFLAATYVFLRLMLQRGGA